MNTAEDTMKKLDRLLEDTLPDDCTARGIGASIIVNECLDAFLQEKGWARDSMGAVTLFASIINQGGWKIPKHIHDRVCRCQQQRQPRTREQIMAPMWSLIEEWGLPTKEEPKTENGVTYYTEAAGSRKTPLIEIKFFKGGQAYHQAKYNGMATFYPEEGTWHTYVSYPDPTDENYRKGDYLPSTKDREEAIRIVLEAVQKM